jgi:allophanate hydrolase subunit 2
VLSGLGPSPLKVGDLLPVGPSPSTFPNLDAAPAKPMAGGPLTVRALLGPRADWLADPQLLAASPWTVSSRSDRVGIRLEGQALQRHESRLGHELLSEGVVRGSIQVPPNGEPVLFLSDHPVTGGYPVVAVIRDADVDLAGQAVPGQTLRIILEK